MSIDTEIFVLYIYSFLPGFTPCTITTLEDLRRDVQQTRRQGYVISMEDVTSGIAAIGAPVRDHTGSVAAAISLSGRVPRYDLTGIAALGIIVVENANQISRKMGFR